MPNLTYGAIDGETGVINTGGTDLISTAEGVVTAYDPGDIAWVLTCSALVFVMIPGLGFLYSGLVRRKNALNLLFSTMCAMAVVTFQWFFWGFSLTFSRTGGSFWGNLRNFCFMKTLELPVGEANNKIPEIVFAIYQSMFASLVPAIALGAMAERSRFLPAMVFTFVWTTLVYDPLAHWIWSSNGWAFKWGVLDYAGGIPIEVASGVTGLAYSYFIGPRRGGEVLFKPHNVSHIVLGTVFLWVGWLGFNGGSTFAANMRAAMAIYTTNLAGAVGGLTWMVMDWRLERKWSCIGFCTGAICGLVAITPAAGFVGPPAAVLVGFLASLLSNLATGLKAPMRVDDPLDIFACHALSGIIGTFLTGIFAQAHIANLDGYSAISGGWLNGNFRQLGLQVAWICVGFAWTFVVTYAIMFVIDKIPGLHFRASEQAEIVGMDDTEHAEFSQDYILHRRDADAVFTQSEKLWGSNTPPTDTSSQRGVGARSIHDDDERADGRGRGVRVHHVVDEEKANGGGLDGIRSEAPEKTGYRQPGGSDNATRLRSRSRGRGLRSVDEHKESGDEVELDTMSGARD